MCWTDKRTQTLQNQIDRANVTRVKISNFRPGSFARTLTKATVIAWRLFDATNDA